MDEGFLDGLMTAWDKDPSGKEAERFCDESGGAARVTISDVNQSNGVIHVVDHVLVPR